MAINDFFNLINQIQSQGMNSADILRNIQLIQQKNQEDQYNLQIQQIQRTEQMQAEQAAQAKQAAIIANAQARTDVNNQIIANNQALDFKNYITDLNNQFLAGNVASLQSSLNRDKQTVINTASNRAGESRSALAGNNIIVNTGSAQGITNQTINETLKQGSEMYTDKINKINSVLSSIANNKTEAQSNALATENANTQLTNKLNRL